MSYIVLKDGTVAFNHELNEEDKRENLSFTEWLRKCQEAFKAYDTKR